MQRTLTNQSTDISSTTLLARCTLARWVLLPTNRVPPLQTRRASPFGLVDASLRRSNVIAPAGRPHHPDPEVSVAAS